MYLVALLYSATPFPGVIQESRALCQSLGMNTLTLHKQRSPRTRVRIRTRISGGAYDPVTGWLRAPAGGASFSAFQSGGPAARVNSTECGSPALPYLWQGACQASLASLASVASRSYRHGLGFRMLDSCAMHAVMRQNSESWPRVLRKCRDWTKVY